MYKRYVKKPLDISLALILIIAVLPVLTIVYIVLSVNNRGKVFFVQSRPGKGGKVFNIVKFKTMNDRKDDNGDLLPDFERLTVIGKFIRKTSIDELPQLINVVRGELSLVGPRPLLVDYLPLYNSFQMRRHEVTPGITGWAQVNGRNAISWEDKFILDVWYVDNISFALDIKILWMTIIKTLKRTDIYNAEGVTMEKFSGEKS